MMTTKKQCNLSVLITRPKDQAQHLCQLIEEAGGKAICFPTITIRSPINTELIKTAISHLDDYHWAIFVSTNAVAAVKSSWPVGAHIKVAAVGLATRKALLDAGIHVNVMPKQQFSSEGLLALPEFQAIKHNKIVIFAGMGGRELLADTLTARGAQVTKVACYQRLLPQVDIAPHIKSWQQNGLDVIITTSNGGLENLLKLAGANYRPWVLKQQLLVVSKRLAENAQALGFIKQPFIAHQASDIALLDALLKHDLVP